ncbi:PAS domain S-box protein [Arcicella lustrica]|uniref:histidine kinase n=1 Tax=Arcicella lustrica TaxID=2984196 RepID=A0ABU5SK45_9BACT|nr:PAS domain S-box protein [Arcicella sp. DC25W]MEA5427669.1 PAS domain S-box protein [Arcicella sp. DC25W]
MNLAFPNNIFKVLPSPCLLLSMDEKDFKIIDINDAYLKMCALDNVDLIGKSIFEIQGTQAEIRSSLRLSLAKVVQQKIPHTISVSPTAVLNKEDQYWEITHTPILEGEQVQFVMQTLVDVSERVLQKQQLEQANEIISKNTELLNKAEVISKFGTWELDFKTNKLHWSDGVYRICGYEPKAFEVNFERGLGVIHPEDRSMAIAAMESAMQTGKEYRVEKRFLLEDQTIKHIISRGSLIKNQEGKPIKLFGVFQDITDEKIQQLALQRTKEELHKIMQSSLDMICTIDIEGRFIQVSDASFKILGYKPEELIGKHFINYVHPEDCNRTIERENIIKSGVETTNFQNRYIHKEGWTVPITWSSTWDEIDQLYYSVAKDATEKKANELALVELVKQYKHLFENNPAPMFIWDFKTLEIVDCNEVAHTKYGYTREEFLALTILDLRPMSEIPEMFEVIYSEESYKRLYKKTRIHQTKNGELIKVEGLGRLMDYQGRRVVLVQINDVTEKENVLQELRDNEIKLRAATNIAKLGYWQVNIKEQSLYWSDEVYVIWGLSKQSFKVNNESFLLTLQAEDRAHYIEQQATALKGEKDLDIQYRIILPDGSSKWIYEIGKIIRDEAGNPLFLEGTVQDITEYQNSQIALKERNKFIETALENLPIGIAVNKIDEGTATLMNKKFSEIYGWTNEDILDITTFFEKIYPDEAYRKEISERIMTDILSGDKSRMSWEGITITTKTGEKRIVNAKNIPIYEQNLMISTVVDVTDKVEAQKSVIESNERYQFASKATSDAIWDWDLENNIILWGEGYRNMFGHEHESPTTILDSWTCYLHPDDKDRVIKSINLSIEGTGNNWYDEYRFQRADGKYAHVIDKGFLIRNEQGKGIRMVGAIQDITLQKERERQLKLLESVVVNTNDAVMITEAEPFDEPGPRILYVNEAFTSMTGYTSEEVIGKTPRILQGPKSDRAELARLSKSLRKWEPCEITTINYKKNGEEFWINFTVIPVADETGWFTHWISIERDITEIKLAEEAQKQLKKLELSLEKEREMNILKNRFTALASHEFRTPIATIVSSIDILDIYVNMIENETLKEKTKQHLSKIVFQSNRLTEMLRDILLLEKTSVNHEEYNVESIDIIQLIHHVNNQYYIDRKDGRSLDLILPEKHRLITSNTSFLNHIISNLVNNAFKYSPNAKNPSLELVFAQDTFNLIITDYGIGIPVADQEHLFELFFRANNVLQIEGTGLGLTITKEFTNILGGQISFISTEGKGTSFTLTFPYDAKTKAC